MDAMPAVSITRGLVLMTWRTPPRPQEVPAARPWLVQQSPTKAATHVDRLAWLAVAGFRHCRQHNQKHVHCWLPRFDCHSLNCSAFCDDCAFLFSL